jgi:xanthine dehydrogenase YagT iron-sulfur-binding subunit
MELQTMDREDDPLAWPLLTRRQALIGAGLGVGTAMFPFPVAAAAAPSSAGSPIRFDDRVGVSFTTNGTELDAVVDPRTSLLDHLREAQGLFGTKKGCDHGQCGACTVHVDGERVAACLTPVVQCDGRAVETIESLERDGKLHVMQQAFIDHDALQCGYCTPGQIMAAIGCVREGHAGSRDEIREYMSGNLCRCGAYENIVSAIEAARSKMEA